MKHLFVSAILFVATCIVATAQIQYQPTYNRTTTESNYQSSDYNSYPSTPQQYSQPQIQIVKTTAYVQTSNGTYKVPIKVQVQGNNSRIIEQYVNTGFGGEWKRVVAGGFAQKCTSLISNNSLDSMFMYKAKIGMAWYYFDL